MWLVVELKVFDDRFEKDCFWSMFFVDVYFFVFVVFALLVFWGGSL